MWEYGLARIITDEDVEGIELAVIVGRVRAVMLERTRLWKLELGFRHLRVDPHRRIKSALPSNTGGVSEWNGYGRIWDEGMRGARCSTVARS